MHRLLSAFVIAAAVATLGCAQVETPATAGTISLEGGWQLASGTVDGAPFPVVAESPITLLVQGAAISGRAACNQYGGTLSVVDGRPRLAMTSMTEMACERPVMAAEAAFGAALPRVTSASIDGERLRLTGEGIELVFDRMTDAD